MAVPRPARVPDEEDGADDPPGAPDLLVAPRTAPDGAPLFAFDPTWCLVAPTDEDLARVNESLLCLADGAVGTRGVLEEARDGASTPVLAAGLYEPAPVVGEQLVMLPSWCMLPLADDLAPGSRVLDLRTGVLTRAVLAGGRVLRTARLACAARPGVAVLVAELSPDVLAPGARRHLAGRAGRVDRSGFGGGAAMASVTTVAPSARRDGGGDAGTPAAAPVEDQLWGDRAHGLGDLVVTRVAAHTVSADRVPARSAARRRLGAAERLGPEGLLAEQRAAWGRRWAGAGIEVLGDPKMTLALRFALFHLLSSAGRRGEAAVGARGLTGPAYAGHVFWDTEAFVLPVLAAVDRRAARAVLEYRIRRLGPARDRAARQGHRGARFPWESALSGEEVTPASGVDHNGNTVPIRTGELEEHITADVAWAAWRYAAWDGDWSFLTGPGRPLVVDTARYWASRVRWDPAGRAHLDGVIGPDEYHENVDDNAFTNLMARCNLRRAARLVEADPRGADELDEAADWRRTAEALVDNYDPVTGCYEQFAGYHRLEPILAAELGSPPLAADLVLGAHRLERSQIVKQADVLMAHLLVPEETAPRSLVPNFDHYLARTVHGSSLSPAVHAALAARAGRPDEALALLRLATSIDLSDVTETTAGGLHLANLGGLWHAVVHGFLGLSVADPDDRALSLAPVLPAAWQGVEVRLSWHGVAVAIRSLPEATHVSCNRPVSVALHGTPALVEPPGRWLP